MRIMTYNIQSGRNARGKVDIQHTIETIRRENPDIVGLNEVRCGCYDVNAINEAAYMGAQLGMYHKFAKAVEFTGGDYGIALLSKYPITEFDVHFVAPVPEDKRETYYEQRVVYRAVIASPDGDMVVLGSHFGLCRLEKEYAVDLALELAKGEKKPLILMGDFNMQPTDEGIARLDAALLNTGKGLGLKTFHSLAPKETIDYVYLNKGFKCLSHTVPYSTASDHLPIVCEIERV